MNSLQHYFISIVAADVNGDHQQRAAAMMPTMPKDDFFGSISSAHAGSPSSSTYSRTEAVEPSPFTGSVVRVAAAGRPVRTASGQLGIRGTARRGCAPGLAG